jgi:hypothetical protein
MLNPRTGWSRTVSSQIRKQLDTVVSPKSKLTKPIKKPKATWVEPTFFADVEYRDITSEGLLAAELVQGPQAEVGSSASYAGVEFRARPSGLRTIPSRMPWARKDNCPLGIFAAIRNDLLRIELTLRFPTFGEQS